MTAKRSTPAPTKITSTKEWKKQAAGALTTLPSGNVLRIRKVGLQTLISLGVMPNSLLGVAQKALAKGKGGPEGVDNDSMLELLQDPAKLAEIGKFMDRMMIFVAQEPKIHEVPNDEADRDDDKLYVDEIGEEDKMFIFQVVTGGTTDVEQFRSEHAANVATVFGGEDLELPA